MGNSLESRSWEGWQSGASLVESSDAPLNLVLGPLTTFSSPLSSNGVESR